MRPTSLLAAILLLPLAANAETLATLPPLVEELHETALPYAQERGELQLTLVSSVAAEAVADLAAEFGLTDDLQLEVGWAGDESELSLGLLYSFGLGELDAALELEVAAGEQEARLAVARILGGGALVAAAAGVMRETPARPRDTTSAAAELMPGAAVALVLPWRNWRLSSELAWRDGEGISLTPGIRWHSPGGDRALALVGQALRRTVRTGDTVGRIGGDEFAVVLPGATAPQAAEVAARVLAALDGASVSTPAGSLRVRCSLGVAVLPPQPLLLRALPRPVPAELFAAAATNLTGLADASLYSAKRLGGGGLGAPNEAEWPALETAMPGLAAMVMPPPAHLAPPAVSDRVAG